MYSDKRTVRGIKRKLGDNESDEHVKPKTKCKDEDRREIVSQAYHNQSQVDDLNDKENNELKIDFLAKQSSLSTSVVDEDEFNNNINDILNSTTYDDLNDEIDKELNNDPNYNLTSAGGSSDETNDKFNTFLNSSLSQCYGNSNRPLTPLPQLNQLQTTQSTPPHSPSPPSTSLEQQQQPTPYDQRTNADSSISQPQSSSSSTNQQSSFNQFPIASISNTKLFNSTSSSLFNAAAIVDTYFSSTTKKSRLEKAKNMNHFRYSLFNKSLAKLNKFCNSSDPNIRNSVLVCNTLKRLERQLRKENIYLHLTPNGLAFIKLKNKRTSPDQLDYRNLILDETSQIYVEKGANNEESDEENEDEEKFIDTDIDFNAAKSNDSSNSCSSESDSDELDEEEDQSDEFSDDPNNEFNNNECNESSNQASMDQEESSPFLEQTRSLSSSLCNNQSDLSTYLAPASTILVNNSSSLVNNISLSVADDIDTCTVTTSCNQIPNAWTEESDVQIDVSVNQFNWTTNMFSSLATLDDQQSVANPKEDELIDNSSYLFNSLDQSVVGQSESTDELFSDIDSLITLYDFDLLTSVNNSGLTKSNESPTEQKNASSTDYETKSSNNSQDSDTMLHTLDSAIGSLNSSLNDSSINASSSSLNNSSSINSATSCSTSASVNSSSTSFPSNQANNAISPVIS